MPEIYTFENEHGEVEVHILVRTFASAVDADEWLAENDLGVVLMNRSDDPPRVH